MMDQASLPGQMRPEDQAAATASAPVRLPTISRTNSPDNDHGNRFQSKLLFLFFTRAINNGYKFHLGTELENFGGKFDDLVFLKDYGQRIQSFLYLQAKHRQDETKAKNKITEVDLLDNNKGDFSLIKYFHSYVNNVMKAEGGPKRQDKVDCVICTNIGFDKKNLSDNGIKLVKLSPSELLAFQPIQRQPTINKTGKNLKPKDTNNLKYVANYLHIWAHNPANTPPCLPNKSFQKYLNETLSKNVIVSPFPPAVTEPMRFHRDFIDDAPSLSTDAKKLRDFIVKRSINEGIKTGKGDSWNEWKFQVAIKIPTCYRLEPIRLLELHFVANVLHNCAGTESELLDRQSNEFKCYQAALFNERVLIVSETNKVITMHPDFINGAGLSSGAKALKNIIDKLVPDGSWTKWTFSFNKIDSFREQQGVHKHLDDADTKNEIEDFFNKKLLFAVNTPNEEELNSILKEEVGKNKKINLRDTDLLSPYILSEMNNWFKSEKNVWLSAEEGEKILIKKTKEKMDSLRATSRSLDYQEELNNIISFNKEAVKEMSEKLKHLLLRRSKLEEFKVTHITAASPKLTAVKVIAALRHQIISASMKPNFDRDDSYLVTSSKRLDKRHESEWIRNALLKEGNPQQLLIVVYDDDGGTRIQIVGTDNDSDSEDALFNQDEKVQSLKGKGVIVIGKEENANSLRDTITYEQLSQHTIDTLLSRTVSFQRNSFEMETEGENEQHVSVTELIGPDEEQREMVLDTSSIEELMMSQGEQTNIEIPSYSATAFQRSLYIKRGMRFWGNFDDTFWRELAEFINENKGEKEQKTTVNELQKQCQINSKTGSIEWGEDIEKGIKGKIWERIIERARNSSEKKISENELLIEENWERRAVIISGMAGTGKSTLLSHFYEEIKKKDSSTWVIRINLTDHQKALEDFDFDKSGDVLVIFDFLVHLPTVLVGDSPFARSLLKHRLESGDRIVLMFDGFDEIDRQCQEKTIHLVKSIVADKTTSIGLFVTTRSHMVDDLQLELGQLAYSLENFDREDQINCVTSFWKADESRSGDEEKEKIDRERTAGKLVDKVTAALKDKERSFIGVPLQCRMVAECFPWHRPVEKQGTATTDEADEKSSFELNIDKQLKNFSLVQLYRLLVQKKDDIYLEEKAKPQKAGSHYVNSDVDEAKVQLEKYLIQLAIKTIVSNPEDANTLLGQTNKFQSEAELEEKESKRGDKGIRYGLLDVRREGGDETMTRQQKKKVVFLHRTYAEYFVADYLYKGFHLEEKQHNKLLEREPVRRFIIRKFFAENDEYNGVRIFFDSMLGELIDTEEWRDCIQKRNLPSRFAQFTKEVSSPDILVLRSSVECRREKTFLFLCDCLDATCDKPLVQPAMQEVLRLGIGDLEFFSKPNEYGDASAKMFQRFLSYFDQEEKIKELMAKLCSTKIDYPQKSYWDGEEQIEIVRSLLEFYEKNRLSFNHIFTKISNSRLHILPLLLWNRNYPDGLLNTYLKLLSGTDEYSENDAAFARAIKNSNGYPISKGLGETEVWIDGRIDKTLIALRDLNRLNVVNELWAHVLILEPEACGRFYIHYQQTSNDKPATSTDVVPINEENVEEYVRKWLKGLLVPDHFQMTQLHREAFFNQKENVKEILDKVAQIVMSPGGETLAEDDGTRSLAQQVANLISGIKEEDDLSNENDDENAAMEIKEEEEEEEEEEDCWDGSCFTPLHVAIVCGHKEVCDAILSFLKRVGIDQDKLKKQLIKRDGMLYPTLCRNMRLVGDGRKKKVEWILKFIKGRLGQDCLLDFLKLIFTKLKPFDEVLGLHFPAIRDIVVSTGPVGDALKLYDSTINEDYYKDLNDLVFHNKELTRKLVEPDPTSDERMIDSATLRGMLSAKGVGDWTRQYLANDIRDLDKHVLSFIFSSQFFGILTRDEMHQQLIEPITEKRVIIMGETALSYWQHFLSYSCNSYDFDDCFNSICTNKNVDVKWFSQLVWSIDADHFKCCKHEDVDTFAGLIRVIHHMSASDNVSQEFKSEFKRLSKERAQKMIQDVFFSSSDIIYSPGLEMRLLELFHFYLDYGTDGQLKEFLNFATAERNWMGEERQFSFWAKWWPHRSKEEETVELFQKLSSEKASICGTDTVKTLLVYDVDGIPFVVRILFMGEKVHADILAHLPKETRDVMEEYFQQNVPQLIDDFFLHPETYFNDNISNGHGCCLNVLRFFLDYADDNRLTHFIKNITTRPIQDSGIENTIWGYVLNKKFRYRNKREREMTDCGRFMRCVKEKLGQEAVKQLAMNDCYKGQGRSAKRHFIAVQAIIGCLDEELQSQILQEKMLSMKKETIRSCRIL